MVDHFGSSSPQYKLLLCCLRTGCYQEHLNNNLYEFVSMYYTIYRTFFLLQMTILGPYIRPQNGWLKHIIYRAWTEMARLRRLALRPLTRFLRYIMKLSLNCNDLRLCPSDKVYFNLRTYFVHVWPMHV